MMSDEITVKLTGFIAKAAIILAEACNCTPEEIVENILFARYAERAAYQAVHPEEPQFFTELLLEDGQLKFKGEELFAVIREMKIAEMARVKKMKELLCSLSEAAFRTCQADNA